MVARIKTVAFLGVEATDVDIQVRISSGLPAFQIVGLADKAIAESRDRIRNAIESLGLAMPSSRITVNLSPADLIKEGSHYDLPIALGVLVAMGIIPPEATAELYAVGELNLDGRVASCYGVLVAAIYANAQKMHFLCPSEQGGEAAWAGEDLRLSPINHLKEAILLLKGELTIKRPKAIIAQTEEKFTDLADIKGQETAKRALEVAAAGGLNMLMIGPAGSGKSMLASRLTGLLPPMLPQEALETSMVHSLAGEGNRTGILHTRPFREPHHSASIAALTGGGIRAKPGEISLAHNGVLFLDELPEFQGRVLDSLRQPLETGKITVARANAHITWPACFQLIAAMNPCRCGELNEPSKACSRAPKCALDYQARLSGPLLDRFDIIIQVPAVDASALLLPAPKEGTKEVKERVLAARRIQWKRYHQHGYFTNAKASVKNIEHDVLLRPNMAQLLKDILSKQKLSARGFHRILKTAQTIADLEASSEISEHHLAEAVILRGGLIMG
ncbi:MAG: YifB family Mg chelatase-like AAA ATPase [Alphaproteobacteria bacterium]